jgi:nucleotide-binding universal stress UspA family protein
MALFDSIVVGTDGSDTAREAVRRAVDLARALGARLQVVSAYEPVAATPAAAAAAPVAREDEPGAPAADAQWAVAPREGVDAILDDVATAARAAGVDAEVHARQGSPADAILDVAEETGADLIVVGNKGMTGAERFLLGSVPNKVSHHAPCSVLIVRTT